MVSTNRITGLGSGMDVDAIVKSSMLGYQNKIDKNKQQKEITEIRQQLYRDIIEEGRDFYDKYFDLAKQGNLLSSSTYATVKFTSSDEFAITATGGAEAVKGNYTVKVDSAGNKAKTELSNADVSGDMKITVGGKDVFIRASELQNSDGTEKTDKEKAKILNNKLSSYGLTAYTTDFNSSKIIIEAKDLGTESNFSITKGTYVPETFIPSEAGTTTVDSKNYDVASIGVEDLLKEDGKDLEFNAAGKTVTIRASELRASVSGIDESIKKANEELSGLAEGEEKEAKIKQIEELTKERSNILSTNINSKLSSIGLNAKRPTDDEGNVTDYSSIEIQVLENDTHVDEDKKFTFNLGVIKKEELTSETDTINSSIGSKSTVTVTGPRGTKTITDAGERFNIDGVVFDISGAVDGAEVRISGKVDTKDIKDKIVNFVNDYNTYMTRLNTLITEKKYRDYSPLTEEQKGEMTEKEIELWEEKVKSGILKGDSDLKRIQNSLKGAMGTFVEGAGITLEQIGIKPVSSYGTTKDGTFTIDEDKLTAALENNIDDVVNLFTKKGEKAGNTGIMHKMKDILNDEVVLATKSSLIKKAGIEGTASFNQNSLSQLISQYEKKIETLQDWYTSKEQALYSKWSKIEVIMNNYNSQYSYLSSMFGGSTS